MSTGALKVIGVSWLVLSILIAGLLVLGSAATVGSAGGSTGAATAMAAMASGLGLAIFIFAQGLLIWAVLNVLAIIAETLIDIRDR